MRYNRKVGSGCKRLSNSGDCTEAGRLGRDDCDPGGGGLVQMRATKPHGHVCKQPMQKGPCLNLHGSHSCSTVVLIGITCPAITAGTVILRAGGKGAWDDASEPYSSQQPTPGTWCSSACETSALRCYWKKEAQIASRSIAQPDPECEAGKCTHRQGETQNSGARYVYVHG